MKEPESTSSNGDQPLCVVVIGASGDLAMRKIFPALFALSCQGVLPQRIHIVGFARTEMSDDAFRKRLMEHLTCRYVPGENCNELTEKFLERCSYVSGRYDCSESFRCLHTALRKLDPQGGKNRIFYFAIPPFLFPDVAHAAAEAGLVPREEMGGWTRVVLSVQS